MRLFRKKTEKKSFDPERQKPVIHCSICNGEQVAGFIDQETGHFEEVMLIRNDLDLQQFRDEYGITGDIEKEY